MKIAFLVSKILFMTRYINASEECSTKPFDKTPAEIFSPEF